MASTFFTPRLQRLPTEPSTEPTSDDPRGALVKKDNVTSWVHKYMMVYSKKKETANCNLCKVDIEWKSSTGNLVSHVRSKHRTAFDKEERADAVKREADNDMRSPQSNDFSWQSKDMRDITIIKYIVSTGQAKGLLPVSIITWDHHPTNSVLFVSDRGER